MYENWIQPTLSKIPIDPKTVKKFHRAIFDEDTTSIQKLLPDENLDQNILRNGLRRMKKFAEKIQVSNVRVLVDAEYRKGFSVSIYCTYLESIVRKIDNLEYFIS